MDVPNPYAARDERVYSNTIATTQQAVDKSVEPIVEGGRSMSLRGGKSC